jgi:hypothetical protein
VKYVHSAVAGLQPLCDGWGAGLLLVHKFSASLSCKKVVLKERNGNQLSMGI